jgi:membrane-associated phospholipid phosphatase
MPRFHPGDIIILLANAALSLIVITNRTQLPNADVLVAAHALVLIGVVSIAGLASKTPPAWVSAVHLWLPMLLVPCAYFELGALIPATREMAAHPWDQMFQAVDERLLGNPLYRVEQVAWAPLSDVLMVCYYTFYIYPFLLAVKLFQRTDLTAFHSVIATVACAFALTYTGYFVFPTLGPHVLFDPYRPAALAGYVVAGPAYDALMRVTTEPPDAFPSGHALIGTLVPVLAWRWHRSWLPWLAPLGLGMVVATLYFRFHYVTDVVVALMLVPVCCWLGDVLVSRYYAPAPAVLRLRVAERSRVPRGARRPIPAPIRTRVQA